MSQKKVEDTPGAYAAGVVTLILSAVVGFCLSLYVMDMSSAAAWEFSSLASFGVVILGGPFWLASGIWCLVAAKKVSEYYKTDLLLLGLLNIASIVFIAFLPTFYKSTLLVWFISYGLAFGCVIFLAYCRKAWKANKRKKADLAWMKKVEAGVEKVGDWMGNVGTWLGKAMIVVVLVASVVLIGMAIFAAVFQR